MSTVKCFKCGKTMLWPGYREEITVKAEVWEVKKDNFTGEDLEYKYYCRLHAPPGSFVREKGMKRTKKRFWENRKV